MDIHAKHTVRRITMAHESFKTLINKLFEARQTAHNEHLRTLKYSAHKALQEYYEELNEFIDELAEVYQGEYEIIDFATEITVHNGNVIEYLESLVKVLKQANASLTDEFSYYKNIIDEIAALTLRTIYKLRFLN